MTRIAYVNGAYQPHAKASVHIEDRGLQFADAVYEVFALINGALADEDLHLERLERSLQELKMAAPMATSGLRFVLRETIRRNRVRNGLVYLQITRGSAPRDHVFPSAVTKPALMITVKPMNWRTAADKAAQGAKVITAPDERWARCDIKSTSLLPNVLAKQAAQEAGAQEAWMLDHNGAVTEGTSSNAWIVNADGVLVTRPASDNILNGVTRRTLMKLAAERQARVEERAFTVEEAKAAREAFMTSASALVTPVVQIDETLIGDGAPGPLASALRSDYLDVVARTRLA